MKLKTFVMIIFIGSLSMVFVYINTPISVDLVPEDTKRVKLTVDNPSLSIENLDSINYHLIIEKQGMDGNEIILEKDIIGEDLQHKFDNLGNYIITFQDVENVGQLLIRMTGLPQHYIIYLAITVVVLIILELRDRKII